MHWPPYSILMNLKSSNSNAKYGSNIVFYLIVFQNYNYKKIVIIRKAVFAMYRYIQTQKRL
jgi:hypothetical protein